MSCGNAIGFTVFLSAPLLPFWLVQNNIFNGFVRRGSSLCRTFFHCLHQKWEERVQWGNRRAGRALEENGRERDVDKRQAESVTYVYMFLFSLEESLENQLNTTQSSSLLIWETSALYFLYIFVPIYLCFVSLCYLNNCSGYWKAKQNNLLEIYQKLTCM